MKKFLASILCFTTLATSSFAINLVVDNETLSLDVPPTAISGRTLVPVRAIFEELGATVEYESSTKLITATRGNDVINLTVDKTEATINGVKTTLDVPAKAINNRTLVPVRFVSEALDANVFWDQSTQTVRVATKLYDVVRVVDGDTIIVDFNGTDERVRMIGIDTPESVHPDADKNTEQGIVASDFTKSQLEGKSVELEFDVEQRDRYGRLLAYVYLDGKMYNKTLLEKGYANMATYPPNVKYVDDFKAIVSKNNPDTSNPDTSVQPTQIYVTKTGTKYHYDSNCNGGTYILSTLAEALSRNLSPCSKCVN